MGNIPQEQSFKQPKTFYFSTITALGERLGYYILAFLMTLFLRGLYQLPDNIAFAVFGAFTALTYITPVVGGYLSDNYLGIKRCMGLGLFLELFGFIILSLPSTSHLLLCLALSLIIVGSGFFKTGPTNLLGRSYRDDDPRIDSGFTLYYMGINIGGFLSSYLGSIHKLYGWHSPFLLAAIGIFFAIIWFFFFKHNASECDVEVAHTRIPIGKWVLILSGTLIAILISIFLLRNLAISKIFFYASTTILLLFFVYQIIISQKKEKLGILTAIILMFMALFFFILYFQMFTSIVLYIERCVDRKFFSFSIPTVFFLSLNPLFIFALSPLYAFLYKVLGKRNKDLNITTKFPLGILLIALCFFVLYLSTFFILSDGKTSFLWIVLVFFLFSAGELFTGALGVAMITQIAPKRLYGIMMGSWFLISMALAADLAGSLASLTSIPKALLNNGHAMFHVYGSGFWKMGLFGLVVAIIGFMLSPWLQKMIHSGE